MNGERQPQTDAGRAMLQAWGRRSWSRFALRLAILDIEDQAGGLARQVVAGTYPTMAGGGGIASYLPAAGAEEDAVSVSPVGVPGRETLLHVGPPASESHDEPSSSTPDERVSVLLAEFDGSVCPACHHRAHDPGSCSECPRCELHADEALAFVLRNEPELLQKEQWKLANLVHQISGFLVLYPAFRAARMVPDEDDKDAAVDVSEDRAGWVSGWIHLPDVRAEAGGDADRLVPAHGFANRVPSPPLTIPTRGADGHLHIWGRDSRIEYCTQEGCETWRVGDPEG